MMKDKIKDMIITLGRICASHENCDGCPFLEDDENCFLKRWPPQGWSMRDIYTIVRRVDEE